MSNDPSRKQTFVIVTIVFLAGIVCAGLFNSGLALTNREEFCTDCHTMQIPFKELQESVHYKNASGVGATCANCHVPESFFPKLLAKLIAAKDVYHELIGTIDTPEKFEARRWAMASRVWAKMKATDSQECRSCHDFRSMDLTEQNRSARSKHGNAEDKGQTCIDCHKGVAHEEPNEPETTGDTPDPDAHDPYPETDHTTENLPYESQTHPLRFMSAHPPDGPAGLVASRRFGQRATAGRRHRR